MSEHLSNIMNMDDSEDTGEANEPMTKSSGRDRVSSIMDMDYAAPEDKGNEPATETTKELPLNPKSDPEEKKEEKEEKEPKEKEEKEEKEPKEKKEEEKKEAEKRKIKYKVDGAEIEEELTDEEIASAVSGRKAIQKRFTELDQQKKQVQKEKEETAQTIDYVKKELSEIKQSFESDINEFKQNGFVKGNPIKSVYNLLDKMGLPAAEFEKAVFFHHLPEVAKFLDMGDAERDAFLLGRENEWLKKGQDAIKSKEREVSEHRAKLEQENSIKRQAGVSEELFSELKEELQSRFSLEKPSTDQVLEWNKVKPFYSRAENVAKLVPGTDINKVARILLEFPETTDEWMLDQLGYKKQQEREIVEELKAKAPQQPKAKPTDDDDDELFSSFRGRGIPRGRAR